LSCPLVANAYNEGEGIMALQAIRLFLLKAAVVLAVVTGMVFWKGNLRQYKSSPNQRRSAIFGSVLIGIVVFGLIFLLTLVIGDFGFRQL
jgi:cytochrome b subunit of formate dehydrogenase